MPLFKKKPVVIEAQQWDGTAENATPIIDWVLNHGGDAYYSCGNSVVCTGSELGHTIAIETLEGVMQVNPGDWVIKGIKGEFYPHAGDFFFEAYEQVGE